MKKLVTVLSILALVVAFGIYDGIRVKNVFEELSLRMSILDELVANENAADSLAACNSLIDWWEKQRTYVEMFNYSTEMRSLPVTLGEIQGSLEVADFQNASSKTASVIILIENIRKTISFDLIGLM